MEGMKTSETSTKVGLVFEGKCLPIIQENEELRQLFIDVGEKLDIVIACRVQPK